MTGKFSREERDHRGQWTVGSWQLPVKNIQFLKWTQNKWTWGKVNFTWHQNKYLRKGYFWSNWPCIAQMSSHKINMAELQEHPIREWHRLQQHWWILVLPHPSSVQFHRIDFRLTKEFKISEMHVGAVKESGMEPHFLMDQKRWMKLIVTMRQWKKYTWKAKLTWGP